MSITEHLDPPTSDPEKTSVGLLEDSGPAVPLGIREATSRPTRTVEHELAFLGAPIMLYGNRGAACS